MKKIVSLGCIVLLSTLMALVSCATLPNKPISKSDLPSLKGKWEGQRTTGAGTAANTDLEIFNDTLPLKGTLTVHNVVTRQGTPGRTVVHEFQGGTINEAGNFILKSDQILFELSLYQGEGKMKLEGDYYYWGFKGKVVFYKK